MTPTERTPRLDPGTYSGTEVLLKVLEVVREVPERLQMSQWLWMLKGHSQYEFFPERIPACGTVACLSGWIQMVTGRINGNDKGLVLYLNVPTWAKSFSTLGLSTDLYGQSTTSLAYELYNLFHRQSLTSDQAADKLEALIGRHRIELDDIRVVVQ